MIDQIIKKDLARISQYSNEHVMDLLDLDEDSAEAVKAACSTYVKSNLGRSQTTQKTKFGRKSARVTRGGPAW